MNVVGITNLMDASKADLFKKMALAKEFSKMTPLELASAYSGLVMYASTNIGGEHYLLGMLVTPSTVSGIEEEVIRWMHVVYATTQGTDKHKNALLFQNITGRSFE